MNERLKRRLEGRLAPNPDTGCLEWTGKLSDKGYGRIYVSITEGRRRLAMAHRVAYEFAKEPIPAGMQIDHLCRNRRCCNPDHLEVVTREENIRRGNAPHMVNARKTHCTRGHEFTPENTRQGRNGRRQCRACQRLHAESRRANRPSGVHPNARKTHCPHGHPLSGDNLRIYKGERVCKACGVVRNRAYRASLKTRAVHAQSEAPQNEQ